MTTKPTIVLYWLEKSRAQRIVWLLEECDVDSSIKVYKRGADMLASPELKKIHPLGKSPVIGIQSPNRPEVIIAESGLITEYLTEYFAPHLVPQKFKDGLEGPGLETESWIRYRFYMHYAEGSLMAILVSYLIFSRLKGDAVPCILRPLTRAIVGKVESMYFFPNFKTHFSFLEDQLSTSPDGGEYLCGKCFTAADILMIFPLQAASYFNLINATEYPKLTAYLQKLEAMNGYRKAIERIEEVTGEPFANHL